MAVPHILAIDQGTTSTRAMVFNGDWQIRASAARELTQHFPQPGWVEHDPEEIWRATIAVCREVLDDNVVAIGITNQRETTVVWNRESGRPIYNAIVWQDRRTADSCEQLRAQGVEQRISEHTGLLLDPYFSATKIGWLLDQVDGARQAAADGKLAFGTIDSFLLWRLTEGRVHATDATNACRTMLYNIHDGCWDIGLLDLFGVPDSMLPEVRDNASGFGTSEPEILGRALPVMAMAGDQHAATVGQACFEAGSVKSTFGTGCFAVMNTGGVPVRSRSRLLTTIAYQVAGETTYALEGSVFMAGAAVQWLRDGLGVLKHAADSEEMAKHATKDSGVHVVPAFTGLGAPYWDPEARGAILGLTRDTGRNEIVRATLEAVSFQVADLMGAMSADAGSWPRLLRVDGGMVANDWLMQFLADIIKADVDRPTITETTALGAAYLAGLQCGIFGSLGEIGDLWQRDRRFEPSMAAEKREQRLAGWADAVGRVTGAG